MATPQELAKVKALVNTGVAPEEAARQVKSDSFGISSDFIAKQQAKRQATTPATPPVAPVQPVAQPAQPVAPAMPTTLATPPVAPVAPEVQPTIQKEPKKEPVFMTGEQRKATMGDTQASKDQMLANVGIMAKEDQSMLTDRAKFNAKTGYDTKPQDEKVLLDQYFNSNVPKSSDELRKMLASGAMITDPKITNTTAFREAKFKNERVGKYSAMNSEQLFNELKAGNIPTWIQNELGQNPNFAEAKAKEAKATEVRNINNATNSFFGNQTATVDPLTQLSQQLTQIFSTQDQTGSTADAFRTYISNNPEITQPTAEYNKQAGQLREFQRAREQLVTDLKKQYAGQPLSTILAIAAREAEPINNQINSLTDSMSLLAADIKSKTDFATQEFGFYNQDQQAKAAKQAKLQESLAGLAISQFGRQQDQAFEMQKMEVQQKYQADRDTQNYLQDLQKMGVANVYDLEKMAKSQDFQKELVALNQKYENSRSVRDFKNDLAKMGYQFELQQQGKALDLSNQKALEEYKASLDPDTAAKWEEVRAKATANSSLADLYGKNVGTYEGNRGYDLAGKVGDAIVAPPGAKVVEVRQLNPDGTVSMVREGQGAMSAKDVGYGNSVVLQLPDGKFMRLSHMSDIAANIGDTLVGGAVVGTRGNSGKVLGANGEKLTPEQLAAGRGAHVDVEIGSSLREDGQIDTASLLSQAEQKAYLSSIKPFAAEQTKEISDVDIATFNEPTFKPGSIKDSATKAKYQEYLAQKKKIREDKNASINDILRFSAGGKELGVDEAKTLSKFDQALGQVAGMQEQIQNMSTGPIIGRLASMNPYNTDAQVLKAQLSSLIPNLARGVYGEVGVLTDQDIQNYAKTIPNLTSTEDVNKAVLAMTLDTIAGGYKKQLRTLAASGRDVSGFVSLYEEIKAEADNLKSQIQGGDPLDNYLKNL